MALLPFVFAFAAALSTVDAARNHAFIGYSEMSRSSVTVNGVQHITEFRVKIASAHGEFVVKLRPDLAPDTCLLVWELAQKSSCPNCKFYRHEPVPQNWGENGFFGPPYALLQGSLADLARQPPFENKAELPVKKGNICMIPNCKEFFIATADHPEWGHSHTIWGEVESLDAEPKHPFEPYHNATDGGGITTRWLDSSFPFTLTALETKTVPVRAGIATAIKA